MVGMWRCTRRVRATLRNRNPQQVSPRPPLHSPSRGHGFTFLIGTVLVSQPRETKEHPLDRCDPPKHRETDHGADQQDKEPELLHVDPFEDHQPRQGHRVSRVAEIELGPDVTRATQNNDGCHDTREQFCWEPNLPLRNSGSNENKSHDDLQGNERPFDKPMGAARKPVSNRAHEPDEWWANVIVG